MPRLLPLERYGGAALLVCALAVHVVMAFHYRIDSDELQHLHVVWGWTRGQLPYRDFFDNHSPLFQALCAPVFALLGERADIVIPMRMLMVGISAGCVTAIGFLGCAFSRRVGWWAAIFAAWWPPYLLASTEFRPDGLWAMMWFCALAVLISGRMNFGRAVSAGSLLGVTFCVSMKTTLMLLALLPALGLVVALRSRRRERTPHRLLLQWSLGALGAMLVAPALVYLFFATHQAAGSLYYCLVTHNLQLNDADSPTPWRLLLRWSRWVAGPVALLLLYRWRQSSAMGWERKALLLFIPVFFLAALNGLWPVITAEDYLPVHPLLALLASVLAVSLAEAEFWRGSRLALLFPFFAALTLACWVACKAPLEQNQTKDKIGMIADILRLTRPDELVSDSKGETIFRQRPTYWVFERMTFARIRAGKIADDLPEMLVSKQVPVASLRRMHGQVAEFIKANYLPIAFRLNVLGRMLPTPQAKHEDLHFTLVIAGSYSAVSELGNFDGDLDGAAVAGPRYLVAGEHRLQRRSGAGRIALVWAPAVARGYSPFAAIKEDYTTPED